jgi:hypothetical protein
LLKRWQKNIIENMDDSVFGSDVGCCQGGIAIEYDVATVVADTEGLSQQFLLLLDFLGKNRIEVILKKGLEK